MSETVIETEPKQPPATHGLPQNQRKQWRWSIVPSKHRKILELLRKGVGVKTTARLVGVGVRTVQRRKQLQLQRAAARDRDTEDEGGIEFKSRDHVCPVHGLVTVWPCVACAAIEAKGVHRTAGGDN